MVHEREPLQWADLPRLAEAWLLDVGVLAALALVLWLIAYCIERPARRGDTPGWLRLFVTVGSVMTLLLYYKHWPNIRRLWDGTEPKIGSEKAASPAPKAG